MTAAGTIYVPIHDPDFYADDKHWDAFRMLRRDCPVYWHQYDGVGYWVLTKYEDVKKVSGNPQVFSSAEGLLPPSPDIPPEVVEFTKGSIMLVDPPRHTQMRRTFVKRLTPRGVRPLEERVRDVVGDILDAIPIGKPFDFVEQIAVVIPALVICELMDIPREKRERYLELLDTNMRSQDPDFSDDTSLNTAVIMQLFMELGEMIEWKREEPGDDLVSLLVHALVGGEPMDERILRVNIYTLFLGGTETTRSVMTYGLQALLDRPDQLRALRADPNLMRTAVDEMIRWTTPIRTLVRYATEDVEVRGQQIKAGEFVALRYDSANRDEEVFGDDADEFVSSRYPNPHLAFGTGEHLCLGLHLARLELRLLFEEMFRRYQEIEPAGELTTVRMAQAVSPKRMPLVVTA